MPATLLQSIIIIAHISGVYIKVCVFPLQSFRAIDEAMAAILVITFLLFLAVIGLNLFIALLSDTFQRVYDNAQAIAILQQVRIM